MSYRQEEDDRDEESGGEELPEVVANLIDATVPSELKGIRACKRCGILKTLDQFMTQGCENCPFLDMVCIFIILNSDCILVNNLICG